MTALTQPSADTASVDFGRALGLLLTADDPQAFDFDADADVATRPDADVCGWLVPRD